MRQTVNPSATLRQIVILNIWHCNWARLNHDRNRPEEKWRIWNYEAQIRHAYHNALNNKVTVYPDGHYYWSRRQLLALNDIIYSISHELYRADEARSREIAITLDDLIERFYEEWNRFSKYLVLDDSDQTQNGQVKE